jgi:hypothetical protein
VPTYHLGELGLEMVHTDVVLDVLNLGYEGDLCLDELRELLLCNLRQLIDKTQVLLNNSDGLLDDCLFNDQRGSLLPP